MVVGELGIRRHPRGLVRIDLHFKTCGGGCHLFVGSQKVPPASRAGFGVGGDKGHFGESKDGVGMDADLLHIPLFSAVIGQGEGAHTWQEVGWNFLKTPGGRGVRRGVAWGFGLDVRDKIAALHPVVVDGLDILRDQADTEGTGGTAEQFVRIVPFCEQFFVLHPAELDIFRAQEYETVAQARLMADGLFVGREACAAYSLR